MNNLQHAINMSIYAHSKQKDKGGTPYINHPIYLALQFTNEDEQIVALLHDVLEDAPDIYSLAYIEDIFGVTIRDALNALTRRYEENYNDYLVRVSVNKLATKIKIQDLLHNLDITRLKVKDNNDRKILDDKYVKALAFLREK